MSIENILKITTEQGGVTLSEGMIFNPDFGFIVGGIERSRVVKPTTRALSQAITSFVEAGHTMIGTWFHEGKIHVDAVEHIIFQDLALQAAQDRGEIAIWDCARKEEVFV